MSFAKKAFRTQKIRNVDDEKALARRRAAKVAACWSSGNKDRIIRAAEKCLLVYSSEQRLERMIRAVAD
jgi:hypothetical protein